MADAPIYITHAQLKRIFPQIDEYDAKTPIYGWTQESALDDWDSTSNLNIWYSHNTGKVSQLYRDGAELTLATTGSKTTLSSAVVSNATSLPVASESAFATNDVIRVNNEYMKVSGTSSGALAVIGGRSLFDGQSIAHADTTAVWLIFNESHIKTSDFNFYYYDEDLDMVITALSEDRNPNDFNYEAGEDFKTLVTQFRTDASRYLD